MLNNLYIYSRINPTNIMESKKNADQLLSEHRSRVLVVFDEFFQRFSSLEEPKLKNNFAVFFTQKGPDVASDLARSSTDASHEALSNDLPLMNFLQELQKVNADLVRIWQEKISDTYNDLPLQ